MDERRPAVGRALRAVRPLHIDQVLGRSGAGARVMRDGVHPALNSTRSEDAAAHRRLPPLLGEVDVGAVAKACGMATEQIQLRPAQLPSNLRTARHDRSSETDD